MGVRTGSVLGDRYEIQALIATGGMGEVWRAHDRLLQRTVCVKSLRSGYLADPAAADRLRAEARAAAMLQGKHLVQVYDCGDDVDTEGRSVPYFVMELVDGSSLSQVIAERGALAPDEVSALVGHVADALATAHAAELVHRDIKPGNILITSSGDVKVTDFGIARHATSVGLTATGLLVGTARYLSPEQVAGEAATSASDIYALGVVAHEALTGQPLYNGESEVSVALAHVQRTPPALPSSVPPGLALLVLSMLAKNPADRPTAHGVMAQLSSGPSVPTADSAPRAAAPETDPTTAYPATSRLADPRPLTTRGLRPFRLAIGVAAVAAVVTGALFVSSGHSPASPRLAAPSAQPSATSRTTTVTPSVAPAKVDTVALLHSTATSPTRTTPLALPTSRPITAHGPKTKKPHPQHGKPKK